ncbi:hypothetical protein D9611_009441 [Ephemerocybe angulata]|uniref:Fungal-type protein kinase domain-containing protein n=1 Tax=Ephemerocybe angulata TaxID=980116 RepID=A0A8H5ETP3_9AGAR|nr:hypothetical protein D9611_009441 [Tulosesus angulatus]
MVLSSEVDEDERVTDSRETESVVSESPRCGPGVKCLHSEEPIHSNITRIHQGLRKIQGIALKTMLKALIMLKREREDMGRDEKPMALEKLSEYGDKQLETLVGEAVEFCNDAARSGKLVDKLEEVAASDSEASACHSLATGLNSVLLDFKDRDIGRLKTCSANDLTLYNTGSNTNLDSKLLMKVSDGKSKSKPDIYESRYEDLLKSAPGLGTLSFEELAAYMETNQASGSQSSKSAETVPRIEWSDIVSCLEVKKTQGEWRQPLRRNWEQHGYSTRSLIQDDDPRFKSPSPTPSPAPNVSGSRTVRGGLKRERDPNDSLDEPSSKRSKTSSSGDECDTPLWSVHPGLLPPEIQCSFYGLELLRSRWNRTHSIVTLFSDDEFSLRWYDSQGCIRSHAISLSGEELPLAVATIILLQRFHAPMRGMANIELKANIDGEETFFDVPSSARPRWEVRGRRPMAVRPLPVAGKEISEQGPNSTPPPAKTPLDNCFFKWYWRESDRKAEKHIVDVAKARAQKYLPEGHASDVIDHLPDIYHSEDYEPLSTFHIRSLCQLDTTGALIPCAMMSKRLVSMEEAFEPDEVLVQVWDILRCLFLLWALGISHGDVSLDNIMSTLPSEDGTKRMVLNDFDLALVMTPGDESPGENGLVERTGTRPFMALDVLDDTDRLVKRIRRYDIESVFWSLLWYCSRKWDWNEGTNQQIWGRKWRWLRHLNVKDPVPDADVEEECIPLWTAVAVTICTEEHTLMVSKTQASLLANKPPRTDKDFLELCETMFPRAERYKSWPWMDFAVKKDRGPPS